MGLILNKMRDLRVLFVVDQSATPFATICIEASDSKKLYQQQISSALADLDPFYLMLQFSLLQWVLLIGSLYKTFISPTFL